ncbi:protein translocase subunit SecE [Agaricicola taiwanensis]|uniref:Protein translocase subunit SecE n=1 Tax=Agaricicola taiwanensis TaxID=591372 RepID=A0A8J2YNX4_9RHOB|nr:preprotein translocase subunit SecE [Agaricicola taiwanensis]GGE55571.1 protein translocase subunit SecE [Agaricicola taiwanensis]
MAKTNPFQFMQEVRNETAKVTWPSRRETITTTIMVFIFATVAAVFFLVVDWVLARGIGLVLGF